MIPDKLKRLAQSQSELEKLCDEKAKLMKQLNKAHRIAAVWPEVFKTDGRRETYITRLGGTGTVPQTCRYWIERTSDKLKHEISETEYNFIKGSE